MMTPSPQSSFANRFLHDRPVLVCGPPRTGTSWVAKALSLGPNIRYLREPITQTLNDGLQGVNSFRYMEAEDDAQDYDAKWREVLSPKYLFSHRWLMSESKSRWVRAPILPGRLLVKEINCVLALDWLSRHFTPRIIVTLRHPCGYVASGLRLQKVGDPVIILDRLLGQPRLIKRYFSQEFDWLARLTDPTAKMAAAYAMTCRVLLDQTERHPEWTLVRHENLCANPIDQFAFLHRAVGLKHTPAVVDFLEESSVESDNQLYSHKRRTIDEPSKWRTELSPDQIDLIAEIFMRLDIDLYPGAEDRWRTFDSSGSASYSNDSIAALAS